MTRNSRSNVLAIFFAVVAGIGSAVFAIDHWPYGRLTSGTWTAHPAYGGASADPYAKAHGAWREAFSLGRGEGLAFTAAVDADGDLLRLECTYRMSGMLPPEALWTVSTLPARPQGIPVSSKRPAGLHARDIVYGPDGSFEISISPHAMPGNWVATNGDGSLVLVLTLYDLLSGGDAIGARGTLPSIEKAGCDA